MTAKRSRRLQTLVKLAQMREDEAARQLGEAQQAQLAQQQQLEQLKHYQSDYAAQRDGAAGQGIDAFQLANYQRFFTHLDSAVAQQQQRIEAAQAQTREAVDAWTHQWLRRQSMDRLRDQARAEEERTDEKKQQKEQDDRRSGTAGQNFPLSGESE